MLLSNENIPSKSQYLCSLFSVILIIVTVLSMRNDGCFRVFKGPCLHHLVAVFKVLNFMGF